MAVRDDIGTRGEAICFVLLTQFCGYDRPLFRPHFLGDKFPTLDYLVEVVDIGQVTSFFFVQVKTTTQGYAQVRDGQKRLRVQVSRDDMSRLVQYPAPTYIIGIDEREEIGYIVAANEQSPNRISSLSTQFPLNCQNLEQLRNEVRDFWSQRDMRLTKSIFSETQEG